MTNDYDRIRNIALNLLRKVNEPTPEDIKNKVVRAMEADDLPKDAIDYEALCRDIETSLNVWVSPGAALDSDPKSEPHEEWMSDTLNFFDDSRPRTEWPFWRRYARYLIEVKRWPENVIRSLDRSTTSVLRRLEDPLRKGKWDRRGMVVGDVQSGKTAHFTGLICKAADAGYKLIVVLTGLHNNLRSQTQLRLDEEFLGFESDKSFAFNEKITRIGVATLYADKLPHAHTLTNSTENGDFSRRIAAQSGITPGHDPILFIIKKNVTILQTLNAWVRTIQQYDIEGRLARALPLLIIDDECDLASINTKPLSVDDPEYDVTATNREIRKLLRVFEQCAYLGYTATPFASIFIYPDNPHAEYGDDLFPRSFIVKIGQPSNYIGPVQVFGLEDDPASSIPGTEGQPIVRTVDDYQELIPDRHRNDFFVPSLPSSMKLAIRMFIISSSIRRLRRQGTIHNSMLVHVSRFVNIQTRIAELVREELESLQRRIRYNDGKPPEETGDIFKELRTIYEDDYIPTSRRMFPERDILRWEEVLPHIEPSSSKILIKIINGTVHDILDYRARKDGLNVIAIGGDKLSRGLTLEGLTASYYLRGANAYDTLMQMGRWFGYRDGYEDLCRIFTTEDLIQLYRWVAMASEELRRDFARMDSLDATPNDFGLRVRMHPGGLLISSLNKLRAGTPVQVSFADHMVQTLVFDLDPETVARNFRVTDRFVANLGRPTDFKSRVAMGYTWRDVPGEIITEFLANYTAHPDNPTEIMSTDLLVSYIKAQLNRDDLIHWTVAIAGGNAKDVKIGEQMVKCVIRNPPQRVQGHLRGDEDKITLNGLTSPSHEAADLTPELYDVALEESKVSWRREQDMGEGRYRTKEEPKIPYPSDMRDKRDPKNGLLLLYAIDSISSKWKKEFGFPVIGLAVSLPKSKDAVPVDYMVNPRYIEDLQ